jgi:hypothetical protein
MDHTAPRASRICACATQFYDARVSYSAAIQPYAIRLLIALLLLDILVTWIQFTAEGQLRASHYLDV